MSQSVSLTLGMTVGGQTATPTSVLKWKSFSADGQSLEYDVVRYKTTALDACRA